MTNPGNALGTNGAYGGRTSVNAFNDVLTGFLQSIGVGNRSGIISGWGVSVNDSGQLVLGGESSVRDVAVALDGSGNATTLNNISGQPITVTLPAAPAVGTRTDYVIGYVQNPPEGNATTPDNPEACGLTVLAYTGNRTPTDSDIRAAITQDGGAGTTAYYVVLAQAERRANETVIGLYGPGKNLGINQIAAKFPVTTADIADNSVTSQNIDWSTMSVVADPTTVTNLAVNTMTTIQSLTISAGKWKISGQFNGASEQTQTYQANIALFKDGTQFSHLEVSGSGASTSAGMKLPIAASVIGVVEATVPSKIDLRAKIYDHSLKEVYKQSCWLIAERIG